MFLACIVIGRVAAQQPNIVYILADDLGWGDLSCYGQHNWTTPRLDRMAAEGMRFTDAYAGSTVCAPSRAALLTGHHTGRVHMRGNGDIQFRRDPHDITIASRLRDLGYRTAMIGKSGVACNSSDAQLPNDKGFDYFFGLLSHVEAHRHYPQRVVRNGEWIELPGNLGKTGTTYASGLFVDDAIEWVQRNAGDEPFFLHLAITPPHADLAVPERYMAPFRGRFAEVPHTQGNYYHQPEPGAAYAGMVAFVDESVGRVLDTLAATGVDHNTVVFFASDNGPHYEGGADPEAFDSNGPWRGGKRSMYEGGIRTPQIVWGPGIVEAGTSSDLVTAFWDFPATALELAGGTVPADVDGISILPTLEGRHADQPLHGYLYWEFYEQGGKQAVRTGPWKGIRLNVHDERDGPIELFNLGDDPGETTDVSADHPEIVQQIVEAFNDAHTPSAVFRFRDGGRATARPADGRRLANANDGYVLDRTAFRVVETSSHSSHNGMIGANAIDGDTATRWHTMWRDAKLSHPHTITLDLGAMYQVRGIRIMARQDDHSNGTLKRIAITVSASPDGLDGRGFEAELEFTRDEQEIEFPVSAGRYLQLTTLESHDGSPFACIANLEVLGVAAD
jgi:arylsulfatase A